MGGPNTSSQVGKDKEKAVEQSQSSSSTPTDPELVGLYKAIECATYVDINDTVVMAPRQRTIGQALQAEADAGEVGENQGALARKRPCYGFRTVEIIPSTSPQANKDDEVMS
ncbi:hypothetical protein LguiB_011662 [Lonicera macranthoides]